jgi:hypothetical protein
VTYLLNYGVTSVVDFQEITASDEEYIWGVKLFLKNWKFNSYRIIKAVLREIITVYSEDHTNYIGALRGKSEEFRYIMAGGACINHCCWKG